jgi:hypothetical protein
VTMFFKLDFSICVFFSSWSLAHRKVCVFLVNIFFGLDLSLCVFFLYVIWVSCCYVPCSNLGFFDSYKTFIVSL